MEYTKVIINDYRSYDYRRGSNGGCYGFKTYYNQIDNGMFQVSYGTTADFCYCPVCGCFNDHEEYDYEKQEYFYSCGEFRKVTKEELSRIIGEIKETEDYYITYQ